MNVESAMKHYTIRIKQEPRDDLNYDEYVKNEGSLLKDVKLEYDTSQYENTIPAQQEKDNFSILQNSSDDEITPEFECHDVKPEYTYGNGFIKIKNEENFSDNNDVWKKAVNNIKSDFHDNNEEQTIENFTLMQFNRTKESDVSSENFKKKTSIQADITIHHQHAKSFIFEIGREKLKSASNRSNDSPAVCKYEKDLQKHIDVVHNHLKPHKCEICQKAFVQKGTLKRHIDTVHNNLKSYECEFCRKVFRLKYHLKRHIEALHKHFKPFKCEVCLKQFGLKQNLKMHIDAVHNSSKPFKCEVCLKQFGYKNSFKKHIDTVHNSLKPFKCEVCQKEFGLKENLKKHIDTVHNSLKPFKCEVCQKEFGFKQNLKRHIDAVHNGLKPFKCEVCQKVFGQKGHLRGHMNSFHNNLKSYKC